jgi:hypothetical protein
MRNHNITANNENNVAKPPPSPTLGQVLLMQAQTL